MSEFDRYQKRYQESMNEALAFSGAEHDFFLREKADHIERLAGALRPSPTVLDVGCGIGLVHRMLQGLTPRLFGIDVAPETLAHAKQQSPNGRYVRYDGAQLPFAGGTFDLVFAVCVLHHVPPERWPAFVAEMVRVSRAGGVIAIFEHNPLNPLTRVVVNRCEFDADAVLLARGHTQRLLAGAGLELVEGRHILFFPWGGGFWRSVERRLGWLPLGAQYYVAARKGSALPPGSAEEMA